MRARWFLWLILLFGLGVSLLISGLYNYSYSVTAPIIGTIYKTYPFQGFLNGIPYISIPLMIAKYDLEYLAGLVFLGIVMMVK